jgi:hypothetical protein
MRISTTFNNAVKWWELCVPSIAIGSVNHLIIPLRVNLMWVNIASKVYAVGMENANTADFSYLF